MVTSLGYNLLWNWYVGDDRISRYFDRSDAVDLSDVMSN